MFEEAQLYSPVSQRPDGTVTVHLGADHPGFTDPHYRRRREEIASVAVAWRPGEPQQRIDYSESEHAIWADCSAELAVRHQRFAHSEYLSAKDALRLPTDKVPQLSEVTSLLSGLTGWSYVPAPGLVPLREFYEALGRRVFHSTQYLRHPSEPLYTPEPDIIHEVIGHANQLASPRFAALTAAAGVAASRLETDRALKFVADVFWFSMEFGVIMERGELKAYGAGICSSIGEMEAFGAMTIKPLDLLEMGTLNYDITRFQPVLYCAESLGHMEDVVGGFFATVSDEQIERWAGQPDLVAG